MMTKKEFHGPEFYAFAAQQYEAARVYLKNCGRPLDEYDKFKITEAKFSSVFYKQFL